LADIFTGRVTNWKQVGGADKAIVILSREVNSGTHIYFKEHIVRKGRQDNKDEFSPAALLMPSSQAIAEEVSQNENAIGYYGIGYVGSGQKAVKVAANTSEPYVAPTLESVKSGAYPITRPLLIYTKGQPQGVVKEFVDFILSPEGQEIVQQVDFVPVR
jgi:phosphate transport system substrate-binding protein